MTRCTRPPLHRLLLIAAVALAAGAAQARDEPAVALAADARPADLAAQVLDELVARIYHDVRRMAAQRMRRERSGHTLQTTALVHEAFPVADPALLVELAQQAILDENPLVRKTAIQTYARLRPEGYQDILLAALEDQETSIQEQAALSLIPLARDPEVYDALQKYIEVCQNEQIKNRLQRFLKIPPRRKQSTE